MTWRAYQFGDWTVEPPKNRVRRGDVEKRLEPLSMDILTFLLERPGETVSVEQLMEAVWSGRVVELGAVHRGINHIRRALGDDSRHPRYIETIFKRGYRTIAVVAPVSASLPTAPAAPSDKDTHGEERAGGGDSAVAAGGVTGVRRRVSFWRRSAAALVVIAGGLAIWLMRPHTDAAPTLDRSLAVMPFAATGAGTDTASYAGSLTEELRTAVAGYRELRIVSAPEAPGSSGIRASYVVGGSLERLNDRRAGALRLRAHLIRTDDRHTVWARTFERPVAEASADPAEMAAALGRFVRLQLAQDQQCEAVRRTSSSAEAAAAYCAALAERNRLGQGGDLDLQLESTRVRRAIVLDPDIADAYRILALNYTVQGSLGLMNWRTAARRAQAALDRGLALAPHDPRLLTVRGQLQGDLLLDRAASKTSLRASIASDPLQPDAYKNYSQLAILALGEGRLEAALEQFRRALRINDSDAEVHTMNVVALWCAGRNHEAIRASEAGLHLVQTGWARAYLLALRGLAYAALGEMTQANAALDDALATAGPDWKPALAGPLAVVGRRDEARRLLDGLDQQSRRGLAFLVMGYAVLDHDRAFAWIHEAIDQHIAAVVYGLRSNPGYAALRQDPRWTRVMTHLESEERQGRTRDPAAVDGGDRA